MKSKIIKINYLFFVTLFFLISCSDKKGTVVSISEIWMSSSVANLFVGEELSLQVFILPDEADKGVTWKSSDYEIASVTDDGLVSADSPGIAVITVTALSGGKNATCIVTVEEEHLPVIRVINVTLNHTVGVLDINETFSLTATVYPTDATNQTVVWESANPDVAEVEDGIVTPKKEGETTISVITEDGNKKATCKITVIDASAIKTVDRYATKETKALFANLLAIQNVGAMFGHHDGLMYGREWNNVSGRSDVKEVCGDYPAVYSLDFAEIMDNRYQSAASSNNIRRRCILEAYARGEVIIACIHINNPLTGGDSWDNSNKTVVSEILKDGSAINVKYKTWLDRLANFANNLKATDGTLIPVLFRPYHEHTQSWSWWGSTCATQAEFIDLWRFTVEYLRDKKNVHNFLYAISPQMDGQEAISRFTYRWPGDDYVDFLGMDCYHGTNTTAYRSNLTNILHVAGLKGKPCGVTETGIEGIRNNSGEISDYWTVQMLAPLKTVMQNTGKTVSMVVMWRNQYEAPSLTRNHYFGPWIGHSSASDFVQFYNDPITIFSADLPDMYQ